MPSARRRSTADQPAAYLTRTGVGGSSLPIRRNGPGNPSRLAGGESVYRQVSEKGPEWQGSPSFLESSVFLWPTSCCRRTTPRVRKTGVLVFAYLIHHPEGVILVDTGVGRGNAFIDEVYFVRVDWKELREKASRNVVQPFEHDSRYLRDLLLAIRNLHFDLADLPLPLLELTKDRELSAQLISGLKLLRATLDVKLQELRKVKAPAFDA